MIRHLKNTKCKKHLKNESQQELQVSPLGITAYKFSQDVSRQDLAHMIVMHGYPFHMVEHKGFLKFVNNLRPQFKVMCDKTTREDCKDYVTSLKKKVNIMIQEISGRLSFTTDLWTSNQNLGYMAVTGLYIFNINFYFFLII